MPDENNILGATSTKVINIPQNASHNHGVM